MFDPMQFISGAGGLFGGLFGHSHRPYDKAAQQYKQYYDKAQANQQPYYDAGTGAIPKYQEWLNSQQNPSQFINDQMANYSESPYAHMLQQQSMRAGQNAASAAGLGGSTPLMQQLQQNAGQISSQDQNQWLQNVLGINTQYGQGQQNMMNAGQNSANQLTNINDQMAQRMAEAMYGREAGRNQDRMNMIGGGMNMIGSFL